jgi:hypothetical protein
VESEKSLKALPDSNPLPEDVKKAKHICKTEMLGIFLVRANNGGEFPL